MLYAIQFAIFWLSILLVITLTLGFGFKVSMLRKHNSRIKIFCIVWFGLYALYILIFTGPSDLSFYPPQEKALYIIVSLAKVMSIVGHSEIKTTNVYLRKAGVEVKGATEDLGYKIPTGETTEVIPLFANELGK